MTTSTPLPTLDRDQWIACRDLMGKVRAPYVPTDDLVQAAFGPCPELPRPADFVQQNTGGFTVKLLTHPFSDTDAGSLSVGSHRPHANRVATSMSAANMRALAAALTASADFSEGLS